MKKIRYILILLIFVVLGFHFIDIFASNSTKPELYCDWLPWCSSSSDTQDKKVFSFISKVIAEWIKYVAVISVISIMISWILYVLSAWEEEKTKKAKTWIIWSLVWVVVSISAWSIINILNTFKIE